MKHGSVVFFDPLGRIISREDFNQSREEAVREGVEDTRYRWRVFDNGRLYASVEARESIRVNGSVPPEHWMRFVLRVENIVTTDAHGFELSTPHRVVDTDASREFRTLDEAIAAYEELLVSYAQCEKSEHGFKEVGNLLTPPNPDMPSNVSQEIADDMGSW